MLVEEIKRLVAYSPSDYKNDYRLFSDLNAVNRNIFGYSLCCIEEVEASLKRLKQYLKNL